MNSSIASVLIALPALMVACTHTMMVPVPGASEAEESITIAVGDTVRVLTKYGERPTFKVINITEKELIGKNQSIPYQDMAFVEKRVRGSDERQRLSAVLFIVGGAVALQQLIRVGPLVVY